MLSINFGLLLLLLVFLCSTNAEDGGDQVGMYVKILSNLRQKAKKSILMHMHIPKAGGTALSLAMSSSCKCTEHQKIYTCVACTQVVGNNNYKYQYSISRTSGWSCNAHSPLAAQRLGTTKIGCKCKATGLELIAHGLFPVYIAMLRDPFDRFVSEVLKWNNGGHSTDWFAKIKKEALTSRPLQSVAKLNSTYIIHNRQIRMLGGSLDNFNMRFDGEVGTVQGSRWKPIPGQTDKDVMEQAKLQLIKGDVIPCIFEQFDACLCVLEVVYGALYSFPWDASTNSHDSSRNFSIAAATVPRSYEYPNAYQEWLPKNVEDLQFYHDTISTFENVLAAAFRLYKSLPAAERKSKYVPHCKAFV